MPSFLLLLAKSIMASTYDVFSGFYNKKKASPYKFCFAVALAVFLFFLFSSGFSLNFNTYTLLWATLYGVCYFLSSATYQVAVRCGSVSLTALLSYYSLAVPTFFSIIAYNEHPAWTFYLGFALLCISLFLIGYPRKEKEKGVTLKWLFWAIIMLLTNGGCGVVMTHYIKLYGDEFNCEFMLIAMALVMAFMLIMIIADRKTKYDATTLWASWGLIAGGFNGALHLLSIILLGLISPSIYYPTSAGLTILVTIVASRIFFKEKSDLLGKIAILFGIASVILLNLYT